MRSNFDAGGFFMTNAYSNRPMLRIGARGDAVIELQTLLTARGYLSPSPIDGIFGPLTQNAVMAFQRDQGLSVDGIVGPITWGALLAPPPAYFDYVVQPGDNLWALSRRFGTTVDAIKELNGLTGDMIFIGQTLKIPYGTEVQPPTPPPPPPVNRPTLRMGSRGEDVMVSQLQLHFWLFLPGPIDGIFGPLTGAAVLAFQRDRGLVADGIVGSITWGALFSGMPWNGNSQMITDTEPH